MYQQEALENQLYFEKGITLEAGATAEQSQDQLNEGKEGLIYQKEQELKEIKNS